MSDRILVTKSSMPPMSEYIEEIAPLWERHWLTNMGVDHKKLEAGLKQYLGIDNIALFTNGHNALECILEAMGLEGEVITTPFSFASTTHAIVRKGLTPVFADIKNDDYTIDPESIEKLITPRTCAIIPVHVYGNLCDVDAIQAIADKHGLKVIYDAALRLASSVVMFLLPHLEMPLCLVSMPRRCLTLSRAALLLLRILICIRFSISGRTLALWAQRMLSTSAAMPR